MNIASTQYSLKRKSLEIYVSGCKKPNCPGCHNSEIQDFSCGTEYKTFIEKRLLNTINISNMIDEIWVLGGEPLDQDINDLLDLLETLKLNTHKFVKFFLFTRYSIDSIDSRIKEYFDFIKTGGFIEGNEPHTITNVNNKSDITLASLNQSLYKKEEDNIWTKIS